MATLGVRKLHRAPEEVRLREEDAAECAVFGLGEREAVEIGIARSKESWVLSAGEVPLVYGGYAPMGPLADAAVVWMLGTPEAQQYAVAIARMGKRAIQGALLFYGKLYVSVAASNAPGRRWAEWLGFTVAYSSGPFIQYQSTRGGSIGDPE